MHNPNTVFKKRLRVEILDAMKKVERVERESSHWAIRVCGIDVFSEMEKAKTAKWLQINTEINKYIKVDRLLYVLFIN